MVGDTPVDVAAGLRAGVAVAGVLWGAATEDELRDAGATTVVADAGRADRARPRRKGRVVSERRRPRAPRPARPGGQEGRHGGGRRRGAGRATRPGSRRRSQASRRRGPRDRRQGDVHGHSRRPRLARPSSTRGLRRLPRRRPRRRRPTSASSASTASCSRLFTDWQMMPAGSERVPNDHSDADYDHRIDRPPRRPARAGRSARSEQFAELEPRLGEYTHRLEAAYDKVLAGDHDFVSGATRRQLPHGLVRAARGPAADARARAGGAGVTARRRPRRSSSTAPFPTTARSSATRAPASPACARSACPCRPRSCLPIEECRRYHAGGRRLDDELWQCVLDGIARARAGEPAAASAIRRRPLLVSVRSGAAVSMPGMMDTILNLGITDEVEDGARPRSAGDPGVRARHPRALRPRVRPHRARRRHRRPARGRHAVGQSAPRSPSDTGEAGPGRSPRAAGSGDHEPCSTPGPRAAPIAYRRHWGIPEDGGTAVVVQAMVFGNLG